jgi:RNA polymerase sigma factor (sigma-70 family)
MVPLLEDDQQPIPDPRQQPQTTLERKQHLQRLKHCLLKLPERDREVLLLDAMADLPQQEIAARMDLNLNTVKTIIRRAKIKLARWMVEVTHD